MNDTKISFGERIKQARELRNMSAADLAANLNVSETTVGFWETSEQELPDEILRRIVGALDVSFSYLHGDSEDPEHKPVPSAERTAEGEFVERRRERLWLRDMDTSASARSSFSCIGKCRELYNSLTREGRIATRKELNKLAIDLEKARDLVDELLQDREESDRP